MVKVAGLSVPAELVEAVKIRRAKDSICFSLLCMNFFPLSWVVIGFYILVSEACRRVKNGSTFAQRFEPLVKAH